MSCNSALVTMVVGLGEVGSPLYTILRRHEPDAIGIDIAPAHVGRPIGIMHICLPFLDSAQFENTVINYVRKYEPKVVVINSTVAPGTTRSIEDEAGIPCVYSPVRGKHSKMVDELLNYVKFVAGTNAQATDDVRAHFEAIGMKPEVMATPEALELSKLLETTYFGLLIAWAQEMNRFAESVNADYMEVGKFFREIGYLPNVLFQPGYIGGHCVMPNIDLLERRFQSGFLEVVKKSNDTRKLELDAQGKQDAPERLKPLALA